MGKNANFVSHKKSKQIVDGKPKLPLAADLVEGEIAINFGKDVETLSIKNESGDVVTFSSDNYYTEKKLGSGFTGENSANTVTSVIESNEKVTALALADLDERKLNKSAYKPTYTKAEIDAKDLWVSGSGMNSAVLKGGGNEASGTSSVAEGSWSKSIGYYSHAEGYGTTASGYASHTEGYYTKANGSYSHVEGYYATASGQYSHAEGNNTKANNTSEHASGQYNVSSSASTYFGDSGNTLFSVGNGSYYARHNAFEIRQNGDIYITSGGTTSSPAFKLQDYIGSGFSPSSITDVIIENEEIVSSALVDLDERKLDASAYTPSVELWVSGTGLNSVVQKNGGNTASGDYSVAEGYSTTAIGNRSHAEGNQTKTLKHSSHAEGMSTTASGNMSHAEGWSTTASGQSSHAEGSYTKATRDDSHAEGYSTIASGEGSHAEGQSTTASGGRSHAEGQGTIASGYYSHAEGYYATASGSSSHAEGYYTKANGDYSHAEGQDTVASGSRSHAEGNSTTASSNSSHAEGWSTTASGQSSHAEGCGTKANGEYSHAEGWSTTASGQSSHAEGKGALASGYYSHAEGQSTTASSNSSHAEGWSTTASGAYSHAEGQGTVASGQSSHAEGAYTIANGDYSHAEGQNTLTTNPYEHASGQHNVSNSASTTFGDSGNTLFSVGNGEYNARHNAFEIRQNGDIYITSGGTTTSQPIKLQDYIGANIEIDQVIDSGTSASTHAVSTSAVYGFVTSYTPSITVDQVLDNTTSASTNPVSSKAVYDAVTDNELVWTNAFVALSGTVSAHTANTEIHVTAADKTAWNSKVDASAIADFFDDAKYEDSGTTKVINFYHGNTIKATIDASDFIVDGMVDDVRIENGNLVIDFNTASGKQDISIPLTDIFDPSNYYNKTAIDNLVGSGFTSSSITEVIIENEKIISAALNDLDDKKLDASAYTPSVELWVSGTGVNSVVLKGGNNTASGTSSVAEGSGSKAIGNYSHAEGNYTTASGQSSHAEGLSTTANGSSSHAEGQSTTAKGSSSHAEGYNTKANGGYSHAEGYYTTANSFASHTEGQGTTASGDSSHAEGSSTTAKGSSSHAEGSNTTANGNDSHVEGYYTVANNAHEHASGQHNVSNRASTTFGDSGNTLFSVGNGTSNSARHNAFEIRQNGDIYITSGGTNTSPSIKLQDYIGSVETVTAITPSNSGSTDPIATKVVAENEKIVSNALNDLDDRKLDASAYTPTDLSNYYKKSETSGATELSTAFEGKVNSATFTAHTADTTAHFTSGEKTAWNSFSAATNASIEDLSGQSETVAVALNELNDRISQLEEMFKNLSNN